MPSPIQPRQNVENAAVPASTQLIPGPSAEGIGTEPSRITSMGESANEEGSSFFPCDCFVDVFNRIKEWFNSIWSFFTGRTSSPDNQPLAGNAVLDAGNAVSHQQLIDTANQLLEFGFDEIGATFPQKAIIQLYFNEQLVGLYLEEIAEAGAVDAFKTPVQQNMATVLREQNLDLATSVKVVASFFVYNIQGLENPFFRIKGGTYTKNLLNDNLSSIARAMRLAPDDLHRSAQFARLSEDDRRRAVQFVLAGHAQNPAAV